MGGERYHHCAIPCLAHVRYRLSITVLDSGFHHVDSGLLVSGTWIPDSLSLIPDSKVQESRLEKQKLPGFQNFDYLTCQLLHPCFVDNGKICWFTVKSHESRVMSPEIISQVARNTELCGSKFYHAQQHPSIPITICRACIA